MTKITIDIPEAYLLREREICIRVSGNMKQTAIVPHHHQPVASSSRVATPPASGAVPTLERYAQGLVSEFRKKGQLRLMETYANEEKCTAILQEAHDNVPEIKTVYYFKPINYLGKWKLCLMDSHHGDQTVVDGDKRDSVTSHYEAEMREKYQREHQQ